MNVNTNKSSLYTRFKSFLYSIRREALFFFLLLGTLLISLPDQLHGWNSAWYAMDYSLGFDSRLLIGSVLKLFYKDFLPAQAVYTFVLFSYILLLLLLSIVLGYALRQNEASTAWKGLLALVTLYLLCPGSPAYLWSAENMGRFDLYLLLLTLIAALCFFKVNSVILRLVIFTSIGFAALSIHQVYLFIFFPLLFTMYVKTATEKQDSRSHILFAALGCLAIGAGFLYFQFFSHINVTSCEELLAQLSARTDLVLNEVALRYEYFAGISDAAGDLVLNQLGERIRYGAVTLLLLTPLAAIYGFLWLRILRSADKPKRIWYVLLLMSHLCFVPAFILTIDWGRWFGAFLTVQALQIIILAAKKDAPVLSALTSLSAVLRRHPYFFIAAGIWMASLQKFQATLLPDAPVFFTSVYKLYSLF